MEATHKASRPHEKTPEMRPQLMQPGGAVTPQQAKTAPPHSALQPEGNTHKELCTLNRSVAQMAAVCEKAAVVACQNGA